MIEETIINSKESIINLLNSIFIALLNELQFVISFNDECKNEINNSQLVSSNENNQFLFNSINSKR